MIESIRKYSGLMIAVLVLVFISFFFMDTGTMRGMSGAPSVIKIDGKGYTEKEFRKMGSGSSDLIRGIIQSGDFSLFQAFGNFFSGEEPEKQLFVGRMVLREAQEEFGIHPDDEEISSYLRKMKLFATQDGSFDAEKYSKFVTDTLPQLGMAERDLRDLASDAIVSQKLQSILGAGLGADRGVVARTNALNAQQVDVELGRLNLDTYQDKIDPKEEEVKAYWEGIQDSFKTAVTRKFTYILVTPKAVADVPVEAAAPLAADATEEAKAAAKKAEEDKKAAAAAKSAEERRKNQMESDQLFDDFLAEMENSRGAGFEELAKKNGWEPKTTELFTLENAPAELKITLRASSQGGTAADELFKYNASSDAFSKFSKGLPVGEGQWLIARLDAEEAPRVKTFAEARSDARAQYISEKGVEALKAAADQAVTKIKEGIAAGKSFADAAKEAGITEVKSVAKVTSSHRADGATEPQGLFEAVRYVDPGTLANNIVESDRAFIVYVAKREVVKEPNAAERLDSEVGNQARQNQYTAFDAWLTAKTAEKKIEEPHKGK